MTHLHEVQRWLKSTALAGIVIPSTDEFLSEFPPPPNRRLQWATGFHGSTGMAIILRDAAALFLDGRYISQGSVDVQQQAITIETASVKSRRSWLMKKLPLQGSLGLDPQLHSVLELEQWRGLATELGFDFEMLIHNPIDALWSQARPTEHRPSIVDYPVSYGGETYQAKCAMLIEHIKSIGLHGLLVSDPEDVSWLLNVRAAEDVLKTEVGEWHIVPSCTSRALVRRDGHVTWFVDDDRLTSEVASRGHELVTLAPPDTVATVLRELSAQGPIGADLRRTPSALAATVEDKSKIIADDIVARCRWRKHQAEVQAARRVYVIDATAVVRFMAWLTHTVPERSVSEFEAAQKLEALRAEHPAYKGPSMPLMSASGASGAQPHYVPRGEGSRRINDHPMFWMDSGGQYFGGSTDNTIALALSAPEPKHIIAHTLVLQSYIALATACVPVGTCGVHLDIIARQPMWREGMDYPHGTGHGVGNYLNIHEGPGIGREPGYLSTVPIETGMIVSNEPGYYAPDDFGVRIESHLLVVAARSPGFLAFETISRLPIDPNLIDFTRLTPPQRQWLADYHRLVLDDVGPTLDVTSLAWLHTVVQTFARAA